ncbi:MAG TPA: hypothetical protein VIV55_06575 [Flavobacterium sp.]
MGKFENETVVKMSRQKNTKRNLRWFYIASSILVLFGIAMYGCFNYFDVSQSQNLGTYDDPEVAFKETQKALLMLSIHLNRGVESVEYIQEYENSKNLIFKK